MEKQKTIKTKIILEGIGLHSGETALIEIQPAPSNTGIVFQRTDIPNAPPIKSDINFIIEGDMFRRSTIGIDKIRINTIEHFLATCRAFDIDNLNVLINCCEFPFFDGSAKEIADRFSSSAIVEQNEEKKYFIPTKPMGYKNGDIEISVIPSEKLIITMWVEYKNKFVGAQYFTSEITKEIFIEDIAPARTFGFLEEIEPLRKANLIKGGSLDNALVFGDEGLVNNTKLRYENEIVRHKVLDFLGDLMLIGKPFKGHFIAVKSGHKSHIEFVKYILKNNEGEN